MQYTYIISLYYIGYGVGIIFFPAPDRYGRKGSMNMFLPFFILSGCFIIYSKNLLMIKIGFFVFGMTHIKNTTSYMHAFELVANRHKTLIPTYINVALASEFVILAGYLYYDPNIDNLFHLWMIIGIISYVIYVF